MPSINSVLKLVKEDYPEFHYEASDDFSWSNETSTIKYRSESSKDWPFLLHELAHGLLKHTQYNHSVDLIQIERDAWDYAAILANSYGLKLDSEIIEQALDTYREWLHRRSTCPKCTSTGFEFEPKKYQCPECFSQWRVNDGRNCALRRYELKNKTRG